VVSDRQQASGSVVVDDLAATVLADVLAALDWARDAESAAAVALHPGIVFGEPVGHGKIRLHGREEAATPAAASGDVAEIPLPAETETETEPEPEPEPELAPIETFGHGTIRLHGRER
jgi:hypothetical protein